MRVAVVGSGIAGLGAAHYLDATHDVHVFEASDRPGGHANTVLVPQPDGVPLPVDTGFLVHNRENYPYLNALFSDLGVRTRSSTMSLSVSCERCGISYAGARPWRQIRNARPQMIRLTAEILRFSRRARLQVRSDQTIDAFITQNGYTDQFRRHFLLPLTAALWSAPADVVRNFPAQYVIDFFHHHGMFRLRRFEWRTVVGGSREYVQRLVARLSNGVRLRTPVTGIERHDSHVTITTPQGFEDFDQVIVACHTDQALAILRDPTQDERRLLGAIPYTENATTLHTDTSHMPNSRGAWASWNYRTHDCRADSPAVTVTYDVSRLQGLEGDSPYLVTLNPLHPIDDRASIAALTYAHPQFTFEALDAQKELHRINGVRRTWYCGAWQGYGFHEDGLRSAVTVSRALGGGPR